MMKKKRIVFMGTQIIATTYLRALLEYNYEVVGVYTQPPRKKGRGLKIHKSSVHVYALENNIKVYTPNDFNSKKEIDIFKKIQPDLVVVMGYGLLIPKKILSIPSFGFINIHVSLLPRWRGASPIEHAILNGDKNTGVSLIFLEEKLDSGPIIASNEIKINNKISKETLTEQLNELGKSLLINNLEKIFQKKVYPQKQNEAEVLYANKITTDLRKINFNNDTVSICNKIRAFSPKPSAWFYYNKERINILQCSIEECETKNSTILNEEFHIGCNNGKIIPEMIQRQGKKPLKIEEFIRGFKFKVGHKVNA